MSTTLPTYAPDGVERKLLAADTGSIPAAQGLAFTVPAPTIGGAAPFSWTPSSNPIPAGLGYFGEGDMGATGLVFYQTSCVAGFGFADFSDLLTLSFPNLVSVDPENLYQNGINIAPILISTLSLISLSAPFLSYIAGSLEIQGCPNFTTLSVPALATVESHVQFELCAGLTSLSFPALVKVGSGFEIQGNSSLTSISVPAFVPTNGTSHDFAANALSASSVNSILARFVASVSYISGTIDLSGGTNAAPTGSGVADVSTLTGRGVTVLTN